MPMRAFCLSLLLLTSSLAHAAPRGTRPDGVRRPRTTRTVPRTLRPRAVVQPHATLVPPAAAMGRAAHPLVVARVGKPIVELGRQREVLTEYVNQMKPDSLEILFQPQASRWGHLLIRVGERVFDYPGPWGARSADFVDRNAGYFGSSTMYGFLLQTTPERVAELTVAFSAAAQSPGPFDEYGAKGESCASFVTGLLARKAPELGIHRTVSAISAARQLLGSDRAEAVIVYSSSTTGQQLTDDASFRFEKIEN